MLARVAWRNIWRNPRRSWVLISAVAIGVFSFLGGIAYVDGFSMQMIDSAIRLQGGHIQIAGQGYFENPVIHTSVHDVKSVESAVQALPGVQYLTRMAAQGIMNSADQAAGVMVLGVDPARERAHGQVPSLIIEGTYLSDADDGVVIGAVLAEQLRAQVGERVVLMANSLDGELSAAAFRIKGLFESTSDDFDKIHVFLSRAEVQTLIGYTDSEATTVALFLDRGMDATPVAADLNEALAGQDLEVLTWRDRSPLLVMMEETMNLANIIFVVILFTAIGFTLVNSFLMVIYERLHEIGVMMANGVRPSQVRWILYLEAIFMVALGILVGTVLASALIAWWQSSGLDLSAFSEGLRSFGSGSVIYPRVDLRHVATGYATILVMVSLAVAWPAWKASRFRITAAMHHV